MTTTETTPPPSPAATAAPAEQQQEQKVYNDQLREIAGGAVYEFEYIEGPRKGEKATLDRHKISNRQMRELELERARYGGLLDRFDEDRKGGKAITQDERKESAQLLNDLYAKMAEYYFGIEREEYDNMAFEDCKANIDTAAQISIRGRPNLA